MLDLALHHNGRPTSLKDIAERQDVSLKYLEGLFATLQASGLVRGIRGAHGGYELSDSPANVTLRQIYETLEGWSQSTRGARSWADLPATAVKYIRRIEELIEAPVHLLSTSPNREDTIMVHDPFVD